MHNKIANLVLNIAIPYFSLGAVVEPNLEG